VHDVCHISLAGWLDVDKPRLAARCSAIEIDAFKEDAMKM